jgi:formylglycine-generating enzyme required for sulfatase activity
VRTLRAVIALAAASLVGSAGCASDALPPAGQLVLYVDTDAPVPPAPGARVGSEAVPALFDRVRVEVGRAGEPALRARDFELHEGLLRERRVSLGIVPRPGDGSVRARVRIFRGDRVVSDEPPPSATLDTTFALPPVPAEGKIEVTAVLRVDDVGRPLGRDAPLPIATGRNPSSLVGTWAGAHHVTCAEVPRRGSGEVCVPGGAFWFGDPALRGRTSGGDIAEERLVSLSPFYLDGSEVTVTKFRSVWPQLREAGVEPPTTWSGKRNGGELADWCTWTEEPLPLGPGVPAQIAQLPINCLSWDTARAYCVAVGKDLPSEAQLEYVMSGVGREWAHPWGDDEPDCVSAVWGRAGAGVLVDYDSTCRPPGTAGWMDLPGVTVRDRVPPALLGPGPDVELVDLAGNVSEWTRDRWSRADEAFWRVPRVFVDPVGDATSVDGDARPVRGGSWLNPALGTRAGFRLRNAPFEKLRGAGVRCGRPAARGPG